MPLKSLPTEVLPSKSWLIIIGLLAFSYFCFVIIEPYINPIILAFIFALLAKPMQSKFMQILNNRINLATMLNLTCIVLIVFIPLSFVLFTIIKQGVGFSQGVYLWSTKGGANELLANHTVQKIIELIQQFFPSDQLTSENIIRLIATKSSAAAGQFLSISTNILGNFANFLVKFALMLFIMFFFIRDQGQNISPFTPYISFI